MIVMWELTRRTVQLDLLCLPVGSQIETPKVRGEEHQVILMVRVKVFFMSNKTLPLEERNPLLSFFTLNTVKIPLLMAQRMLRIRKTSSDMPKVGSKSNAGISGKKKKDKILIGNSFHFETFLSFFW